MELKAKELEGQTRVSEKPSTLKALLTWLIEADREYRVAQKIIEETHRKL